MAARASGLAKRIPELATVLETYLSALEKAQSGDAPSVQPVIWLLRKA